MKLLLVEDHVMFREGLRLLMCQLSKDLLIEEASTMEQALARCAATGFDLILLDLGLSTSSGIETLVRFRAGAPNARVVVLSGTDTPTLVRQALDCGAAGFVPKTYASDAMIQALRFILAGGIYVPPCALRSEPEADKSAAPPRHAFEALSPRQKEVALLLLQGLPNKLIARRLQVSEGTIKAHVSAVFHIIGARSRVEAMLLASKAGFPFAPDSSQDTDLKYGRHGV